MSATRTMNEAQIKEVMFKHLRQIAPEADPSKVPMDINVREALDIDSFDHLNLLIALNEALGVEIPEADYGQLDTMNNIIKYLAARMR